MSRRSDRQFQEALGKPCHWCRRPMDIREQDLMPTRDHVHPKSKGGRFTVWACWLCNNLKGDMLEEQWEAFMIANPGWTTFRPPVKPLPYEDSIYILKYGTKAWREMRST